MIQFHYPAGATPLTPDETEGLIPKHITRQAQLNEWEQANILQAMRWAFRQRKLDVLAADFLSRKLAGSPLSWASNDLTAADENRRRYIAALRAADAHDYRELLEFCNGKPRPLG